MATRSEILSELHAAVPRLLFGLREPHETVCVPPRTLWERIKQVFTGPHFSERLFEIEIAVIGTDITDEERVAIGVALEWSRPAGVKVTYATYGSLASMRSYEIWERSGRAVLLDVGTHALHFSTRHPLGSHTTSATELLEMEGWTKTHVITAPSLDDARLQFQKWVETMTPETKKERASWFNPEGAV